MNFKKNEKTFNPANSEVFKMVQDMDRAPREPEPGIDIDPADASPAQKGLASRTIQSRTFQRIAQQTNNNVEQIKSPLSPKTNQSPSPTSGSVLQQKGPPNPSGKSSPLSPSLSTQSHQIIPRLLRNALVIIKLSKAERQGKISSSKCTE